MIFKTIYLLKYLYISRYSFKNQIYFCAAFQFLCTWTFGRQLGRQKMALNSIIGWILFYLDRDLSSMKLMLKPNLANIRSEKSWVSHFFFAELVNYLLLLTCQTTVRKIYYKMAHMKLLLQYNRNRISESNGKVWYNL